MKISTAIILIALGIWIGYEYPAIGDKVYYYVDIAINWISTQLQLINSGG